jgi:hypothetical protein
MIFCVSFFPIPNKPDLRIERVPSKAYWNRRKQPTEYMPVLLRSVVALGNSNSDGMEIPTSANSRPFSSLLKWTNLFVSRTQDLAQGQEWLLTVAVDDLGSPQTEFRYEAYWQADLLFSAEQLKVSTTSRRNTF